MLPLSPYHLPSTPPADPAPPHGAPARALVDAVRRSSWLASLVMRRLDDARGRLGELRVWLAGLTRRARRAWARQAGMALPAAALLVALTGGEAQANTITVDVGAGGNCSLAEAIGNANDTTTGQPNADCGDGDETGADTIRFQNANTPYGYTTALPGITTAITIQGNGNTTIQRTGGPAFSVLSVTGGGSLGLVNATISGGSAALGGGIYVRDSVVSLTDATISGNLAVGGGNGGGIFALNCTLSLTGVALGSNSAAANGGAIYARLCTVNVTSATISGNSAVGGAGGIALRDSTASVTNATISGNSADGGGGIAAVTSTATVTSATISGNTARAGGGVVAGDSSVSLANVTISGNSAGEYGGGIHARFSSVDLVNATISGNSAGDDGGGIASHAFSTVRLTHVTVTGNSAANYGGGIHIDDSGAVESQSSIVAGQAAGGDCGGVPLGSGGYNIESDTSCGFTATGDQQNVAPAALNLGPLAPNAPGTTRTHALGPGSAALDRIPPGTNGCGTTVAADQRGVVRPQFGSCDVGAYELAPTPTAAGVTRFTAAPDPTGRVRIAWETASEVDVVGFRVQRAAEGGAWTTVGSLVPARGSAAGGASYGVTDTPGVGRFAYRLEAVEAGGAPQTFGPVETLVRAMRAFLPVGWGGR